MLSHGTASNVLLDVTSADGSTRHNLSEEEMSASIDTTARTGKLHLAACDLSLRGTTAGTVITTIGFVVPDK